MNICILGNAQAIHVQRWVNYFSSKGHRISLLSSLEDNFSENVRFYYLKPSRVKLRYVPVLIEEVSYPLQALRLIRKIKPDILHAFYAEFYGWLGALSHLHPFVITVFGGDLAVDPQKSRYIKSKVAYALRHADRITAQNRTMIKFAADQFNVSPNKIEHLPWGIDLSVFYRGYAVEGGKLRQQLNISAHAPVILSLRQMSGHYQIEYIVKSIPGVLDKYPQAVFVFLGNLDRADKGQYRNAMIALAKELNVFSATRFLGSPIDQRDMPVYLNMADIAVSIPKTDQFGLTVLEAMACGCMVIVNHLECYREHLTHGQNAFYVSAMEPEKLAQCISGCLENPQTRERFYQINHKIVSSHENWELNAIKMEQLYEQLVAGK